jgi:DeoR family transcriptional regulator of aga operon
MTILEILSGAERQLRITELLNDQRRISLAQISSLFAVSEATARRDLDALSQRGLARRVHGGAISADQAPPEPPILKRGKEQAAEKQAIARLAYSMVQDGETLFLGSGSTILAFAELLHDRALTVITNSLAVLNELTNARSVELIGVGGSYRPSELSFIGHITEQALSEVRADKVFLGIRSIDAQHGLTNDYLPETLTDRAILRIGLQTILLADHTKMGRVSSSFLSPAGAVSILITDSQTPPAVIAALQDLGVKVLIATN